MKFYQVFFIFDELIHTMNKTFTISENYKKAQKKSIFWIFIFLLTLILSVLISLAIFVACVVGGFTIFFAKPMLATGVLGAGLLVLGSLIVYYNFKFIVGIFKQYDKNGVEIVEEDYPELFQLIKETADNVGVKYPKKVFINDQINASVTYSNQIQSLIFPTRKNLTIGLGLLHAVSKNELKGIIAHEFGHFSQKSMIIGSHAGNASRVMYDIIYSNDAVRNDVDSISQMNAFIGIISGGAIFYTKIIGKVLSLIYTQLDHHNMALSREMEFHADQIATNIVGIETMSMPLLRIDLYDFAYNEMLQFYFRQSDERIFSDNVFQNVNQLVKFYSNKHQLKIENGLEVVELYQFGNNFSRIQLENLGASHPSIEDRLHNIKSTNIHSEKDTTEKAITLIKNYNELEENFSFDFFFNQNLYRTNKIDQDKFIALYKEDFDKRNYPEVYNDFFNNYDFEFSSIQNLDYSLEVEDASTLFSDENMNIIKQVQAWKNDALILEELGQQKDIKQFKYNGIRYDVKGNTSKFIDEVKNDISEKESEFYNIVNQIILFFKLNLDETKTELLHNSIEIEGKLSSNLELVNEIREHVQFITKPLHEKLRQEALIKLNHQSDQLKKVTRQLLTFTNLKDYCMNDELERAQSFVRNDLYYFFKEEGYNESAFNDLFNALAFVQNISYSMQFDSKYKFLKEYESLLKETILIKEASV